LIHRVAASKLMTCGSMNLFRVGGTKGVEVVGATVGVIYEFGIKR
jgi:hypothetical protein